MRGDWRICGRIFLLIGICCSLVSFFIPLASWPKFHPTATGHCWSDESTKPPISPSSPIHPSTGPKCTHAYAVSPKGARRLLLHLTYPPFAFSRALDQAFAHLIRSGRINAFSVVPSIVIQRRERNDSDIWATSEGSGWKEMLKLSAFDEIENGRDIATLL